MCACVTYIHIGSCPLHNPFPPFPPFCVRRVVLTEVLPLHPRPLPPLSDQNMFYVVYLIECVLVWPHNSFTYVWPCAAWILTTFPLYLFSPGISLKLVGSALSDSVLVVVCPDHYCFSMTLSLSLSLSLCGQ